MLVLGAIMLAVPAVTLASGGGSAGDQQYTDPFAGTPTSTATHTAAPPTTTTAAPAAATTPASSPTTLSAAPTSTLGSTMPSGSTSSTSAAAQPQLAYTGYDAWMAAGFGLVLVAGGLVLRRRTRHS